ncbi:hypothetical protein [Microbispora sp. NBRC 16548]|uniref:hypothetical protein n=1 Tax=Microbispora sp. NBRC 16548 TaxID=3030994 RepID=UPI0024A0D71D|nr:hypothetical protein [Microbispora sp. NBRC 16548]GLX08857.1 hypothetical protein Misp03_57830 [Microbispora sp. NBRC 16548]
MRDPVTEDAYEQDGSLIRPYITGEGQHGGEGDRFWSEEQDEHVLGGGPDDRGDVLSEDWRPDQPAQTPADHADQDDYAAGRTARLRSENPVSDEHLVDDEDLVSDGDTDPRGFLGSGWRNAPDPDEDDDERSRRGGMLLRTGLIAVGVLGAIWALALWVGQPSGAECEDGAGCAARAGTAATAPVSPAPDGDATAGESDTTPTDAPTDAVPSDAPTDAPTAEPTRTRPGTSGTSAPTASSAPTHPSRSRAQDPGSRSDATPRPSRSRVSVDTQPRSSADERSDGQTSGTDTAASEEQAATAPTSGPATEQPTSAPAPTQESSGHGGGLFGWLFG